MKKLIIKQSIFVTITTLVFFTALSAYGIYKDRIQLEIDSRVNQEFQDGYEKGRLDQLNESAQLLEQEKWDRLSKNPEIVRLLKLYFPDYETARTIRAIATAESSGHGQAVNLNKNGTYDSGWLQVNSIHKNSTETVEQFIKRMHNPEENIKLASIVFKKQGFRAWTQYKNGAYLAHLK